MELTLKEKKAMNRAQVLAWTVFGLGISYLVITLMLVL